MINQIVLLVLRNLLLLRNSVFLISSDFGNLPSKYIFCFPVCILVHLKNMWILRLLFTRLSSLSIFKNATFPFYFNKSKKFEICVPHERGKNIWRLPLLTENISTDLVTVILTYVMLRKIYYSFHTAPG